MIMGVRVSLIACIQAAKRLFATKNSSDTLQTSLQKANETMDTITDLVRYMNENPAALLHGRGIQPQED